MACRIKGCEGELYFIDPATATEVFLTDTTSFGIEQSSNTSSFNVMGDCDQQTAATSQSYTVSGEGFYCTDDAAQALICNGGNLDWVFYPRGQAAAPGEVWSGNVVINSVSHNFAAGEDLATFSYSGEGNGGITSANAWIQC